jgi:DNA-binding transcriptional LysR family regulator
MDHLRAIGTFLRCAESTSFTQAARHMGLTPQAVSHQIAQLEQMVGARLFNRTTRRIGLTEEGEQFHAHCKAGVASIADGLHALSLRHDEAIGTVRLCVPNGISQAFIMGLLPRFLERHPRVFVDMLVQNEAPDVVGQGIDVGIIGGELPSSSLVARRVASFRLVLCASGDYIARHGAPARLEDLRHHRCVAYRRPRSGKLVDWSFTQKSGVVTLSIDAALTVGDTEALRHAVLNGAGIGQVPSFYVQPHLASGRLVRLLPDHVTAPMPLHIYVPRRKQLPLRSRVLADFLLAELRANPAFAAS